MHRRTVLLAPDKFKGSLDATAVAHHLAEGIHSEDPAIVVRRCPIADGGEGTVAAALAAGWQRRTVRVDGPTGAPVEATYAVDSHRAVVELAESCGLQRLPGARLAPWTSSTYGLGQNIAAAVADGATDVVVGLGGSASTDGGAGLLQALGAAILDRAGAAVRRGNRHLGQIATTDLAPAGAGLAGVRLLAACDVTNPLLGRGGAAQVFGPQKGLQPPDLPIAEDGLSALHRAVAANTLVDDAALPGAGAAGGAGYALLALGATFRPGIDVVAELTGLGRQIDEADLVVTGEGCLDHQSLGGKGPMGVTDRARSAGVPVVAVVGRNELVGAQLESAGFRAVFELVSMEPDAEASQRQAPELLGRIGRDVARLTRTG